MNSNQPPMMPHFDEVKLDFQDYINKHQHELLDSREAKKYTSLLKKNKYINKVFNSLSKNLGIFSTFIFILFLVFPFLFTIKFTLTFLAFFCTSIIFLKIKYMFKLFKLKKLSKKVIEEFIHKHNQKNDFLKQTNVYDYTVHYMFDLYLSKHIDLIDNREHEGYFRLIECFIKLENMFIQFYSDKKTFRTVNLIELNKNKKIKKLQ